ncbi:MAG: uracil-xanthine permease family protein [Candidatus Izemoplasmatales bacterium]|uniref:Uracil permease n=1 Tax=Hujiaoplasma nucleasis TaxID=2725268 RepID=A0A7L6N4E1_9MOLU|nr:solute carrier family 23 protein [Hujiaoplasma nucleasis]QLY40137.1 uracil permease [Hujiaoplasma nucleasis]
MENNLIIGINEKPKSITKWIVLSLQHVFAMFGATILVPIVTGLDHGVALVASGIGTLIYILCTKGKVPVYLGSSFAYMTAISLAGAATGYDSAYVGLMLVGIVYVVVAFIIRFFGSEWIKKLLPPIVIGPMIIIIGLYLSPIAIGYSGLDGSKDILSVLVAIITFITIVIISVFGKGFFKIIPFIIAILIGYIASIIFGIVDVKEVFKDINFFQVPDFVFLGTYKLDFSAALLFLPIAFVTIAEHIGDHVVLGEITQKDFLEDPGLKNTLVGDGIATFVSAALGGPANTTYGENTGVVAMTRVGSVYVVALAAIIAISLGFLGYIQAFVGSIPEVVLGGMTIVLYGLIASNGIKVLIKAKTNMANIRNIIIVSTMLVIGLGGAAIPINEASSLTGMSLAAMVGIILNLALPENLKSKKDNQ